MSEAPYITMEAALEQSSANDRKIVVMAIDALTWDILNPMIARGELPNFERMVRAGSYGILDPVDPMLYSPRIWTTVATGKMPEKHGITFFLINPYRAMQSGKTAGSDLRQCLAIWNIVSHFKKQVHVSNWMVSWPAEPVYGTVLSDHVEMDHGVWPRYLQDRIRHGFLNESTGSIHRERINQRFFPWVFDTGDNLSVSETIKMDNLRTLIYRDEFVFEKSIDMLKDNSPDLSLMYLRSIDIASHFYWKYSQLDKNDPRLDGLEADVQRFGQIIPETYRWADEKLGRLVDTMPEDTTFIILSDHGFETHFTDLRGYDLMSLLNDLDCAYFKDGEQRIHVITDTSDPIDALRKVYVLDDLMPQYTVATGKDRDQVIQEILDKALSVRTLDGKRVLLIEPVENLQLMQGEEPPDLVVRFNHTELTPGDTLLIEGKPVGIETYIQFLDQSGNHDSEAVIIVSGSGARQGHRLTGATTLDIVPTILTLFDLPVADDMDGFPLFSAFHPEVWDAHPVTRIDTYETKIDREIIEVSEPERPNIIEQLQAIGYIQ